MLVVEESCHVLSELKQAFSANCKLLIASFLQITNKTKPGTWVSDYRQFFRYIPKLNIGPNCQQEQCDPTEDSKVQSGVC
jgi:hypothetical protein